MIDVIGTVFTPGQYDEEGNQTVAPVLIPGWHVITTNRIVGLDANLSEDLIGREFAGVQTYHYVFTDETEAKSLIGWTEDEYGGRYTPVFQSKLPVPDKVTMRQARLALLQFSLLDTVENILITLEGDTGKKARIEWEYAQFVEREWPTLIELASQVGLSEEQIDDLFRLAVTL